MPDEAILMFLDQYLGVRLSKDTPRSMLFSKLNSLAVAARDV